MTQAPRSAWKSYRHYLAAGFLIASSLYLLLWYISWRNSFRGISESKATGLAAVSGAAWDPVSMWQQRSLIPKLQRGTSQRGGVVGGVPGGVAMSYVGGVADSASDAAQRQVVRTGSLQIVATNPAQRVEQLRDLSARLAGFVVSSNLSGRDQQLWAKVVVRIPAVRFDEARREIRKLAASVEEDTTEARDVTRESFDQQAALRNYRAEEEQYLAIMKRAITVKDVLEVSEKLADVRGRIDRLETEIRDLNQQVAMSLLTVGITSVAEARVLGLNWRPLYEAKLSARNALGALADFSDALVALILYVPVILLWGVLVLVVLKLGWLVFSRLARLLFPALPFWRRREARTEGT